MSTLRVGAALPDPPFELLTKDGPAGFDIALMQGIAGRLGRERGMGRRDFMIPHRWRDGRLLRKVLRGKKYEERYCGGDKDRHSHQLPFCESVKINGIRWKETKAAVRIKELKIIATILAGRRVC